MNASKDHAYAFFKRAPRIEAVDFTEHWLVMEGGMVFQIAAFLDEDKEEMEDDFNSAWYYAIEVPWSEDFLMLPSYAYPDMPSNREH